MTIDPIPISPAAVRNQIEVPSFLGDEENERLESQQLEPYSEIELLKPFKNSIFRRVMDSPDGTYEMIINVDSIQITDHPLLCEELKIANDIESLIDNWKERKRSKIVDYLSNKLKVPICHVPDRSLKLIASIVT